MKIERSVEYKDGQIRFYGGMCDIDYDANIRKVATFVVTPKKIKIIALFGPAGAGKDTIMYQFTLLNPNLNLSPIVSCTTRPPREGEEEGKSYYFLSKLDFEKKIRNKEMLEYTEFRGWYYGTSLDSLKPDKINIGVFNIEGIESLKKNDALEVIPVYVKASDKSRLLRQLSRESEPDCLEICRRFQTDRDDFWWIDDADFQPFHFRTIDNGNMCFKALTQLANIVKDL